MSKNFNTVTDGNDEWLTPRYITDTLGPFDLDPCSPGDRRPWDTATYHLDIETTADEFGTDRKQIIQFRFRELTLKDFNLFPEVGDIIIYNDRLHEVDGVIQDQFLGSIPDKSFSIVCDTHYSRLSKAGMFIRS